MGDLWVTGLCAGNSPATGEFPAQMASNEENASIWWRDHVMLKTLAKRSEAFSYCVVSRRWTIRVSVSIRGVGDRYSRDTWNQGFSCVKTRTRLKTGVKTRFNCLARTRIFLIQHVHMWKLPFRVGKSRFKPYILISTWKHMKTITYQQNGSCVS